MIQYYSNQIPYYCDEDSIDFGEYRSRGTKRAYLYSYPQGLRTAHSYYNSCFEVVVYDRSQGGWLTQFKYYYSAADGGRDRVLNLIRSGYALWGVKVVSRWGGPIGSK